MRGDPITALPRLVVTAGARSTPPRSNRPDHARWIGRSPPCTRPLLNGGWRRHANVQWVAGFREALLGSRSSRSPGCPRRIAPCKTWASPRAPGRHRSRTSSHSPVGQSGRGSCRLGRAGVLMVPPDWHESGSRGERLDRVHPPIDRLLRSRTTGRRTPGGTPAWA